MVLALLVEGYTPAEREQMLEQLEQPLASEEMNVKLRNWARERITGA